MEAQFSAHPRVAASPFAIGEPGRAAVEMPAGLPRADGPADAELSAATVGGMLIRAATVRGLQHRASGSARQDAFAIGHVGHVSQAGKLRSIVAVCDGVGSYGRSDEAARLVSRLLVRHAGAGQPWRAAFACANAELLRVARRAANDRDHAGDPDARAMATTAVALTVHREDDAWVGEVAWVGDSTLWQLDATGQWELLSSAPGDDQSRHEDDYFHSNSVRPMPSENGGCAYAEFRAAGGALFLMTDGVANPLRWSGQVRAAMAAWWTTPPDPYSFAAQVGFARRTHVDDRTVVGLWPDVTAQADDPAAAADGGPP
jgi:hypothetical protein